MSGPGSVLGLSLDVPVWLGGLPLADQVLRTISEGEGVAGRMAAYLTGRRGAKMRAALLYTEVLYNIGMLTIIQQARPPRLVASTQIWEAAHRDSRWFNGVVKPTELALIAGPYLHLATVRTLFDQDPLTLLEARLGGADQTAVEGLAQMFRDAEPVLRKHFNRKTRKRLQQLMEERQKSGPPPRQPIQARIRGAAASLPPPYWFRTALAIGLVHTIESWLHRAGVLQNPTGQRKVFRRLRRAATEGLQRGNSR
jgi:hypothetical protein